MNLRLMLAAAAAIVCAASAQAAPMAAAGSHASLACASCHKQSTNVAPTKENCLACHGSYDKLAERTKSLTPNPHLNHRGEQNCTNCHAMHKAPRFECNDCHTFNIQMKAAK